MKKMMIMITIAALITTAAGCSSTPGATVVSSSPDMTEQSSARADNDYDMMGEIVDIIGNEVTLKLMEMAQTDTSETRVPGSGAGRNGGGSGTPIEKNYTGEEMTLIIPVGTPLFTRITSQGTGMEGSATTGTGPVEKEIGLNELARGTTLKIRYMADGKTIEKILAQKPRT